MSVSAVCLVLRRVMFNGIWMATEQLTFQTLATGRDCSRRPARVMHFVTLLAGQVIRW